MASTEDKRKPGRQFGSKGRNNLGPEDIRKAKVVMTLSRREYAALKKRATAAGLKMSVYARQKATGLK